MKTKHILSSTLLIAALLAPTVSFAGHSCTDTDAQPNIDLIQGHACRTASSGGGEITTVAGLIDRIATVLNAIVPFIIGLAVFVILWGIFTYITHAAEEEKRQEAKQYIIWGIIGVFFMLSIWGFVNVLYNSFALDRDAPLRSKMPSLPCIPIPPATTC